MKTRGVTRKRVFMLLFHGTTVENARQILQNGFVYEKQNWNCSSEETYFFNGDTLAKEYDLSSREEIIQCGVREGMTQSFISLAIENPDDYRGAVLVFDTDLMKNAEDIEPDTSCENMSDLAIALRNPDMSGLVGYYEMDQSQNALRYYTLAHFVSNQYIMEANVSQTDLIFINAIAKNESMMCEMCEVSNEVDYSEVDLNELLTSHPLAA